MAIACCVCTAFYLARSSGHSLISVTGGFLLALLLLHSFSGCSLSTDKEKRKLGKVANGEAYRQEVGVISSGSYQSCFLYDLSDEKRERAIQTEKETRKRVRKSEKIGAHKCFRKKHDRQNYIK